MKKLLTFILLATFLATTPVFAQDEATQQKVEETVEILNSTKKPALVYFYSKWCHSCRKLSPVMEEIKTEFTNKYNVLFINTDDDYSYAFSGHFKVNAIPAVFIHDTKNNKRQKLRIYSADKKNIEELLNKYYEKNYAK